MPYECVGVGLGRWSEAGSAASAGGLLSACSHGGPGAAGGGEGLTASMLPRRLSHLGRNFEYLLEVLARVKE